MISYEPSLSEKQQTKQVLRCVMSSVTVLVWRGCGAETHSEKTPPQLIDTRGEAEFFFSGENRHTRAAVGFFWGSRRFFFGRGAARSAAAARRIMLGRFLRILLFLLWAE
jgi:hypothetical protein